MTAAPSVIVAPRPARVLLASIFGFCAACCLFIALYPPYRLLQVGIAVIVLVVFVAAAVRSMRLSYVLTNDALLIRGMLITRSVPWSSIASVVDAGRIRRTDGTDLINWGFHADRAYGEAERSSAVKILQQHVSGS
jgi:hypothetical protein